MTDKPDTCRIGTCVRAHMALNHTRTFEALDTERAAHEATKAELQALQERVANICNNWVMTPGAEILEGLRSLLPAPELDPLVAVMKEYGHSHPDEAAERMAEILTRRGLTIAAIGGKHDWTITTGPEQFPLGCTVYKPSGPEWSGKVVGYYSSTFTPEGLVIECTGLGARGQVHVEPAKRMLRHD